MALGQHIGDSRKRNLVEKHLQKGINEITLAQPASKTRDALSGYVETILCIFKFTGQLGLADKPKRARDLISQLLASAPGKKYVEEFERSKK